MSVININPNPIVPVLPKLTDKTKMDIRYSLIEPFANAHIYWNNEFGELIYEIEEPILKDNEKEVIKKLEEAMIELININVVTEKTPEKIMEYVDKTAKFLISELNLVIEKGSYEKIFYYLYRDFVGFNEVEPLLRDYFIEDIECNGVNTPIYIVHRKYHNIRTTLKFKDVEYLASFVEKLAQRSGKYVSYSEPLLDGTLPDGSVDYNEPLIYRVNGIVKTGKIGEVVDNFYNGNETDKPVDIEGVEVVAFDSNFKINWRKAQYVYRHKINEELYNLELEFGRKVKLTGNHSIFVLRSDGVKSEKTEKLQEGDYVVLPSKIPENNVIQEINLVKELANSPHNQKLVLREIPQNIYEEKKEEIYIYYRKNYEKPNQAYYEHKNKRILPIKLYNLLSEDKLRDCFIGTTSTHYVPAFLKVNRELMWFLGLYIAEGWLYDYNSYGVTFSLNKDETDLIAKISESAKNCFNLDTFVEKPQQNGIKVKIDGLILWLIMKEVLKVSEGAHKKMVPELIWNVSKELQQGFIKAWHEGDYSTTVSEQLANDISYLALFNNDIASFYKSKPKKTYIGGREINSNGAYYSNFYARPSQNPYPSMIPMELFNPLNKTNFRLKNKRIERKRLLNILHNIRYQMFENLDYASKKFLIEWEKRGFIEENRLTKNGIKLLQEIKIVEKLINSDFCFAKIKKISRVKSNSEYVYDFSVKGDENFVAGVGGICCHNSRVNATYTQDVTSRGPTFTLRKFTKIPWTPVQLISFNTLSPEMLAYFWLLIQYKANIFIAGGTSSGKTTLLNAIAFFIPPESHVISIEDTRELNLPRENWIPAVARVAISKGSVGEIDLFDLLKNSFRQNPNYVIVGEVRGKEAFVLFQGMASGHPSISTMHADSVDTLIRRLETPPIELSPTLVNSLDCVAIMTHALIKKNETRRLREIVEIVNVKGDGMVLVNTPFKWSPSEDTFFFKKDSKVFEKISVRYGITMDELQNEFANRTKLLYELYKRKMFSFEEVSKIIVEYYRDPKTVLSKFGINSM